MGGEMTLCTQAVRFPDVCEKKDFVSFIPQPAVNNIYCITVLKVLLFIDDKGHVLELSFKSKVVILKIAVKINIEILL